MSITLDELQDMARACLLTDHTINRSSQRNIVDGLLAIADGLQAVAESIHALGCNHARTPYAEFGALELLSKEVRDGMNHIAEAVNGNGMG